MEAIACLLTDTILVFPRYTYLVAPSRQETTLSSELCFLFLLVSRRNLEAMEMYTIQLVLLIESDREL